MPVRVSVFDHHPVVHHGLVSLLPQHDFVVVSQAFDGRDAVAIVSESKPDIVITDVRMPGCDGLKILERLVTHDPNLNPNLKTLVYSVDPNPVSVARSIVWGSGNFVLKSQSPQQLIEALQNLVREIPPAEDSIFDLTRRKMTTRDIDGPNPHALTDREYQVLRHLGFGLSNREIARSLSINVETVKEHVQNILRKQDSGDRTQAAVWAVREGLV